MNVDHHSDLKHKVSLKYLGTLPLQMIFQNEWFYIDDFKELFDWYST